MINQVKNVKIFKLQNSLKNLSLGWNLGGIQNICDFGPSDQKILTYKVLGDI